MTDNEDTYKQCVDNIKHQICLVDTVLYNAIRELQEGISMKTPMAMHNNLALSLKELEILGGLLETMATVYGGIVIISKIIRNLDENLIELKEEEPS